MSCTPGSSSLPRSERTVRLGRACLKRLYITCALCFVLSLSTFASPASAEDADVNRLVNDRCPVMIEEFASPLHEVQFEGVAVRFCCRKCRDEFDADPTPYVSRLPQLPPETVQALVAGGQEQAKADRAAQWVNRWSDPILLALATAVAVWLVIRIVRRRQGGGWNVPPANVH
jgi:hypothetical protein